MKYDLGESVTGAKLGFVAVTAAALGGLGCGAYCLVALPLLSWAKYTLAAVTLAGVFFVPALVSWLDMLSRTYFGAVMLASLLVLFSLLFGAPAVAVSVCVAVTSAVAYALPRTKTKFTGGLIWAACGGVAGVLALLGVLGATLGKPISEAVSDVLCGLLSGAYQHGNTVWLDSFAAMFSPAAQSDASGAVSVLGITFAASIPQQILSMSLDGKIAIVQPVFALILAATIPALGICYGLASGGLGYYLPSLSAYRRAARQPGADLSVVAAVPPFASFKVPRYAVFSILILEMLASLFSSSGGTGAVAVSTAADFVLRLLMMAQSLSLFAFLLNRKKVKPGIQYLILVPAGLLFGFWLMLWVGIIDVLFDIRAVTQRVDTLRAKNPQAFGPGGMDALKRMEQQRKKDGKNGGDRPDGEDGKQ